MTDFHRDRDRQTDRQRQTATQTSREGDNRTDRFGPQVSRAVLQAFCRPVGPPVRRLRPEFEVVALAVPQLCGLWS
eukprot:10106763-Lingulodinium_polyedra.AAC.1